MNLEEFNILNDTKENIKLITPEDLSNKADRTLLYGYMCDRSTWHVYLKDNKIFKVIYRYGETPCLLSNTINENYCPNKRLYPECCDFEFCTLLKQKGIDLSFTTWNNERPVQTYYGKILEDDLSE